MWQLCPERSLLISAAKKKEEEKKRREEKRREKRREGKWKRKRARERIIGSRNWPIPNS